MGNRPQLRDCLTSTPAARIPKWRSTLRNSFLTAIGTRNITTEQDLVDAVQHARTNKLELVQCKFSIVMKVAMHPYLGLPIIYHDQLNIVAQHVAKIKDSVKEQGEHHRKYINAITPKMVNMKSAKKKAKLTQWLFKVQQDWNLWKGAEHKQLD